MNRIRLDSCAAVFIDVQESFLSRTSHRARIELDTARAASLFHYLKIPMLFTVERPLSSKGGVPEEIVHKAGDASCFEKDFFDLTRHPEIVAHLNRFGKPQIIVGGCETDVCVLQSVLGLLSLGYQVYVVEELLFSSTKDVTHAVDRLKESGVTFLSFKTLYYELLEATEESAHRAAITARLGDIPSGLLDQD